MRNLTKAIGSAALGLALLAGVAQTAEARERPLTITRHHAPNHGIELRDGGNTVVAWGGFSANGYGYPIGSEAARRASRNESVRYRTSGVYGYGFDGLGGTGLDNDDLSGGGYNNPNYGNAYNAYTGYGGVPTALAFGPGFASRHITDSDDADNDDVTGPEPEELGFGVVPTALGLN